MPISADRVIVELEAKLDRYTARVTGAERQFDRSMKGIQGSAGRAEARVNAAFRSMSLAAGGITIGTAGAVLAAREFLRYADAAKNLEAQLKLATRESGSFSKAQEDVRRIAAETRSGIEETANLYATFQRNARELGITQEQAARATETVTKAFQISGASAAEAAGGLRQFLQGIQSGTLRGEELNSVLENAPRLAKLIADSLGITIGQLRALGQEGKLAGDQLIAALTDRKFTEGIDAEFRELPVTFDQAMVLVRNAAITTFGAFDRGGEFSTAIANFITQGTEGFADLEQAAEDLGANIRSVFAGLSDAFDPLLEGARSVFGQIGGEALSLQQSIASLLGTFDTLVNLQSSMVEQSANMGRNAAQVALPWMLPNSARRNLLPPQINIPRSDMQGRFNRGANAARARLDAERAGRIADDWRQDGTFGLAAGIGAPPETRTRHRPAASGGGKARKGPRGPSADTVARRAESERVAEERRQQAFDNELASLNADFLAARRSITVAADALAEMERQEIEMERKRYEDNLASQVSQKKLTQAEAERLERLNNDLAAERTRAVDLREKERMRSEAADIASADLENQRDLAQVGASLADTQAERRDAALRLLDISMEMERLELEGVIASRDSTEAQKEIARRRLAILGQIEAGERDNIERENEGPLARYRRELERPMSEQLEELEASGIRRLGDEFAATTAKAIGLKGAIGEIVEELIKMVIQQQLILPLLRAFGGGDSGGAGGGSGILPGDGGLISKIFGSIFKFADGGSFTVGGRGGRDRNVMSINNQPVALVGRGERVTVTPQGRSLSHAGGPVSARSGGVNVHQTFVLDARHGITTPQLLEYVNKTAKAEARNAGGAAYQQSMRDAPAAVQTARRFGGA